MRMALLNIAKYFLSVLRTPIISGFPLGFLQFILSLIQNIEKPNLSYV